MPLTSDDVRRIAHLARLHITDDEAARTLAQLNDIFAMIEQIQAVDTTGVVPMSHPLGGAQRLRDDAVTEVDVRDAALRNAPAAEAGLFVVPRVVE
jgi:aspartyl-tRNA(Asn)/glutamyl-tRNA(Gln) amidotransferase subunit C